MSQKANYFKIGVFVLTALGILIAGIIMFGAGSLVRNVLTVETYVDQSVQGLSVGSPLMQRGVQIGRVEKITFVSREYGQTNRPMDAIELSKYVMVIMSVDKNDFPEQVQDDDKMAELFQRAVDEGLRLKVNYQGITGIAYMEADFVDVQRNPPLEISWKPKNVYIPWAPGTLASFKQSAETILRKLEKVDFDKIAADLDNLLNTLNTAVTQAQVDKVRNEIIALVSDLRESNSKFKEMLNKENKDGTSVPQAIAKLNNLLDEANKIVHTQKSDIEEITENIRRLSVNLREFSEYAKKYPSQVLFGKPPERSEIVK